MCGNGAIDPGEDCDGSAGSGEACGAPGDVNQCRFTCGSGDACPSGSVCGLDQRCRAPSATFTTAPGPVPFVAAVFHTGDVDGDGFADLTGVEGTRLDVLYSDGSGNLASSTAQILPTAGNDPTFGDLDGDGRQDVIVPVTTGVVSLLGGAGGYDLHPYALLDLTQIVGSVRIEQARTGFLSPSDVFFAYDQFGSGAASVHDELTYPMSNFQTCLDGTVLVGGVDQCGNSSAGSATIESLLDGDVAIGQTGLVWSCATPFGSGATCGSSAAGADPTDEVAIAIGSASKVALVTSTGTGLGAGIADPATLALAHAQDIALDSKSKVATSGHMTFADFDGDGCSDLGIPTSGANAFVIAFNTRGTGTTPCVGTLSATAIDVPSTQITTLPGVKLGTPRLFVDLDGNGVADLVTNTAIYIATCGGAACRTAYTATAVALVPRGWASVVAGDFNHDGHMDIAGFDADQNNVDVMLNNGSDEFTRFTLITDLPVREIVAGDFDGDFIQDLAIVTGEAGTTDEADELVISYGQLAGGPTDPIEMGTFGAIDAMARIDVPLDTTTNLVIADDRTTTREGTVLLGTTTRQVIAPFETPLPVGAGIVSPTTVLLGNFDSTPGIDLVEIASAPAPSAFLLSGTGSASLVNASSYTDTGLTAQFASKVSTVWSEGGLTPGGYESIVGISTLPTVGTVCGATDIVIGLPPPSGGSDWTVSAQQTLLGSGAEPCFKIHGTGIRDLDGDGAADALIQMCNATTCQDSESLLVWGDGAGGLDLSDVITLPQPSGMACGRFTELPPVLGAQPILIAPCTPKLTDAGSAAAASQYAGPVLVVLELTPGASHGTWAQTTVIPIAGSDLRTGIGDFNGDGLIDFALTSGLGDDGVVQVYLQCAANDPACAAIAPVDAP